jgi:hypothetical protein
MSCMVARNDHIILWAICLAVCAGGCQSVRPASKPASADADGDSSAAAASGYDPWLFKRMTGKDKSQP